MKELHVQDVMQAMNQFAPPALALKGDSIGLQIGSPTQSIRRVWVALEATPEVIAAAATSEVDLIVTHHAILFRPLTQINPSHARDAAIARLLSSNIAVFAAHTNLDVAPGGVNDEMVNRLGLVDADILDVTHQEKLIKLVAYVPNTHADAVRSAITQAGAGAIGNYSDCAFSTDGIGTFRPGSKTTPFIGRRGELEHVDETRLETVVMESHLPVVLQAMHASHPYEEVAYDLILLQQPGTQFGIGRIGQLPEPMSLAAFADKVKETFQMTGIRYAGDDRATVHRVAVLSGSGSKWIAKSLEKGADVLVTSDVGHHDAAEAWQDGLAVIDATHAAIEQPVCDVVVKHLRDELGTDIEIARAPINVDPFRWK